MPTTPTYGLPYPAPSDPADVPLDMQELAEQVESVLGAQLPIAGGIRKLKEVTLGANAANIDLTSIPQTAAHLLLVATLRSTQAGVLANVFVQFNGAASTYLSHFLRAAGTAITATGATSYATAGYLSYCPGAGANPGSRTQLVAFLGDYTRNEQKTMISLGGMVGSAVAAEQAFHLASNLYNVAGAVTSIKLNPDAGQSFTTGCRATLYGLG